jgi:hypothetical protein
MALTTITVSVANTRVWSDPNTGSNFQVVTCWENYTNHRGESKNRKWTLWLEGAALDLGEGDTLDAKGDLGTKVDTWHKDGEDKSVVAHSLHAPTISNHNTSQRRGGTIAGVDQDDVLKYGHPTYGTDGSAYGGDMPF